MAPTPNTTVTRDAAHRYWSGRDELLGVTRVLDLVGFSDFSAPWFTDEARDRGGRVAAALKLDHEGQLDDEALEATDPDLVPYVTAHRAFLADAGGTVEFCEQIVADEAYGFAGTLDEIVRQERNGRARRMLIDVKLGLYPSVELQTAAYARAARALYPEPVILERRALILKKDGDYSLTPPFTNEADEGTFLAALKVIRWRQAHGLLPKE